MDMKEISVYVLIHEIDGENNCGTTVSVHTSHDSACNAMVDQWCNAIEVYKYTESKHGNEYECFCELNSAGIRLFDEMEYWRIEVHTIEIPEE